MDTDNYRVIITPTAYKEIDKIYIYLTDELYAEIAAKNLMKKIEDKIERLRFIPKLYMEIGKVDELGRKYRRIIVNNYIILYTILENEEIVYISHIYYGRSNYINKL